MSNEQSERPAEPTGEYVAEVQSNAESPVEVRTINPNDAFEDNLKTIAPVDLIIFPHTHATITRDHYDMLLKQLVHKGWGRAQITAVILFVFGPVSWPPLFSPLSSTNTSLLIKRWLLLLFAVTLPLDIRFLLNRFVASFAFFQIFPLVIAITMLMLYLITVLEEIRPWHEAHERMKHEITKIKQSRRRK